MKITLLGSGSAYGTPMIFNRWREANPQNPKNRRSRASLLLEAGGKSILVDAGPDIRNQINDLNIKNIDAVLLTHGHYDHIGGVPELPRASKILAHTVEIWSSQETMAELKTCYGYLFKGGEPESIGILWKTLPDIGKFDCCGLALETFQVPHHHLHCSAFRYKDFAYVTDWEQMSQEGYNILNETKVIFIECNNGTTEEKNGHSNIKNVQALVEKLKIEKVVLTHLSGRIDYDKFQQELPNKNWQLGYDGLVMEI